MVGKQCDWSTVWLVNMLILLMSNSLQAGVDGAWALEIYRKQRLRERIADRYTCLRAPNRGRFMDAEFQQYQMRKFHSLPPGGKYPSLATGPNVNIERV